MRVTSVVLLLAVGACDVESAPYVMCFDRADLGLDSEDACPPHERLRDTTVELDPGTNAIDGPVDPEDAADAGTCCYVFDSVDD